MAKLRPDRVMWNNKLQIYIEKWRDGYVPSVERRKPRRPQLRHIQKRLPDVSAVQLQVALDKAMERIAFDQLGAIDDTFAAMFGGGIRLVTSEQSGRLFVMGLGDPTDWNEEDGRLYREALVRAKKAMRLLETPDAIAKNIMAHKIPSLKQATSRYLQSGQESCMMQGHAT